MRCLSVNNSQANLSWLCESKAFKTLALILATVTAIGLLLGGIFGGGAVGAVSICTGIFTLSALFIYGCILYYNQAKSPIESTGSSESACASSAEEPSSPSSDISFSLPPASFETICLSLPPPADSHPIPSGLVASLRAIDPESVEKMEDYPLFYIESRKRFENACESLFRECLDLTIKTRQNALLHVNEPLIITVARADAIGLLIAFAAYREGATVHIASEHAQPSNFLIRLNNSSKQLLKELLGPLFDAATGHQIIFPSPSPFLEQEAFPDESFAVIEDRDLEWLLTRLFNFLSTQDRGIAIHHGWQGYEKGEALFIDEKRHISSFPTHVVIGASIDKEKAPLHPHHHVVLAAFSNPWGNHPGYAHLGNFIPEAMLQGCMEMKKVSRQAALAQVFVKREIRSHLEAQKRRLQIDGAGSYRNFSTYQKKMVNKRRNLLQELSWAGKGEKWLCDEMSKALIAPELPSGMHLPPFASVLMPGFEDAAKELMTYTWQFPNLPNTCLTASPQTVFFAVDWPQIPKKIKHTQDKTTTLKNIIRLSLKQHLPDEAADLLMTQLHHLQAIPSDSFSEAQKKDGATAFLLESSPLINPSGASKGIEDAQEIILMIKRLNQN